MTVQAGAGAGAGRTQLVLPIGWRPAEFIRSLSAGQPIDFDCDDLIGVCGWENKRQFVHHAFGGVCAAAA